MDMARRQFMCEELSIFISSVWRSVIICLVRAFFNAQLNCSEGATWRVSIEEAE